MNKNTDLRSVQGHNHQKYLEGVSANEKSLLCVESLLDEGPHSMLASLNVKGSPKGRA